MDGGERGGEELQTRQRRREGTWQIREREGEKRRRRRETADTGERRKGIGRCHIYLQIDP